MPRHHRNPIEARGRIGNFRAKPIAVIDVGNDKLGVHPNKLALEVQFYVKNQQVKKDYDTRVAMEWYLDNIFIPEFIKRALAYFSPSSATSSKDLIRNYPKPVQDKMLEESLDEHLKHFGLPQIFPVEAPFSFDGHLIVPGDIAVGYTGLVRKKSQVGYYDMPTEEQILDGVSHFGKVAFFRYDWMLSDSELEKRYKLKDKDKLSSSSEIKVSHEKSQSELYEEGQRKERAHKWYKGKKGIGIREVSFQEDYESAAYVIPVHDMTHIIKELLEKGLGNRVFYSWYDGGVGDVTHRPDSDLIKYAYRAIDVMLMQTDTESTGVHKYKDFADTIHGHAFGIWFTEKPIELHRAVRSFAFPPWSEYKPKFDFTLQPGALIIGFTGDSLDPFAKFQSTVVLESVRSNNLITGVDVAVPFFVIFPSRWDMLE